MIGKIIYNAYNSRLNLCCMCVFYFKLAFLLSTKSFSDYSKYIHQLFSVTQTNLGFQLVDSEKCLTGKLLINGIKTIECGRQDLCMVSPQNCRSPPLPFKFLSNYYLKQKYDIK